MRLSVGLADLGMSLTGFPNFRACFRWRSLFRFPLEHLLLQDDRVDTCFQQGAHEAGLSFEEAETVKDSGCWSCGEGREEW